ncbi:hypothetical protein WPS_12810 [Vulcanimicrobium alpinum]|uniref:Uncharacterized protein n=1 Tax=Vulcanimicrobium alpinum TaxID=3016050 RepID=A0AAN1XV55_UNVUL|nr:DUF6496 domain-containing protein [Vulcanimicrobium alpinum]BDE06005.1 hypothetical protein WPS_12810 [Vulcanimicrobium alpinum]
MATRTTRKKATWKTSASRKKTTTARKKTGARKAAGTRKKSTGARKKTTGRKKAASRRKYSRGTSESVREEMHEMKRGELRSGRSRHKVTNPKQAIAIGLSEARAEGKKVPPNPNRRGRKKSS